MSSKSRADLPTCPYEIVRDPFDKQGKKWVAKMHSHSQVADEVNFVYGGSFDSPEECQSAWGNDVPLNIKELKAAGYKIKGAKKAKVAKSKSK